MAENGRFEDNQISESVGSRNQWDCLKIHVDLFKNETIENYELSAFQNIKNYQNPPNSHGDWTIRRSWCASGFGMELSQHPRGSFQNENMKKYELSVFQNIKNYPNPPNSDGERSDSRPKWSIRIRSGVVSKSTWIFSKMKKSKKLSKTSKIIKIPPMVTENGANKV